MCIVVMMIIIQYHNVSSYNIIIMITLWNVYCDNDILMKCFLGNWKLKSNKWKPPQRDTHNNNNNMLLIKFTTVILCRNNQSRIRLPRGVSEVHPCVTFVRATFMHVTFARSIVVIMLNRSMIFFLHQLLDVIIARPLIKLLMLFVMFPFRQKKYRQHQQATQGEVKRGCIESGKVQDYKIFIHWWQFHEFINFSLAIY